MQLLSLQMTDCIQLTFQTLQNVARKGFRLGSYHHVERRMMDVHNATSKPNHQGIIFGLWDSRTHKIQYWLRCDRYVQRDVFWLFNKFEDAMTWESKCHIVRSRILDSHYPPSISLMDWAGILERLAVFYTYELITYNCQSYCRVLSQLFCIHNGAIWEPPHITFIRVATAVLSLGQSEFYVLRSISDCQYSTV